MIWNDLQIHNAEYVSQRVDGALHIFRFPKNVIDAFGNDGYDYSMFVGRMTTGCELRFVCDAADLILSSEDYDGSVDIYRGDFRCRTETLPAGQMKRIELRKNQGVDNANICDIPTRFDTNVWRVIFNHGFRGILHNVEAFKPMRPPVAEELPKKTMLCYGSSITHGASADDVNENSYIANLGKLLKVDILNKGMGGSCHCEPEVADYIAQAQWDIAFLELAVNMVPKFSVEEFARRASYVIEKVVSAGKPVVVVSHYRNRNCLPDAELGAKNDAFIAALEKICADYAGRGVHYIRGKDMVKDYTYLSADLVHPSTFGHFQMAMELAQQIKKENLV